MGVVKLPNEEVRQMMQSLAEQKFVPHQGWEFKLERDTDFISRYVYETPPQTLRPLGVL